MLDRVRRLVEDYRARSLWFLDPDFLPRNEEEAHWVLDLIERYGDRAAFERSAKLRVCLSPRSSPRS